ncbi:MAG: SRPBCC domain-containing protein [Ignavibacteriaceae bacterium]
MRKEEEPIIIEETFNVPVETVWNAITQVEQMCRWFFENIPSFKAEVGFEIQFNVKSQDRNFLHKWKITEVEPLKKVSYDWKYANYPGNSFVVFELFEENNSTRLRLTHQVTESFPQDIPEFKRESGIEGWNYFIKNALKAFLENNVK